MLEGFSKAQINNDTGGPKDIDMLFSLEEILEDFKSLEVLHASSERIFFDEGLYHQGEADVVRYVGKK